MKKDFSLRYISEIGKEVQETQYNSVFTYDYIQNIWWKKAVLEYFDVDEPGNIELKPRVRHFRSSNIKLITNELENHWSSIVENNICMPIHQILICDEDENVLIRNTTFLSDKIENFTSLDTLSFPAVCQPSTYEEIVDDDVTDFR